MLTHKLTSAAAAVAAIVTAAAVPTLTGAQASGGKTQILRFFDKPVAITLTGSNGKMTRRPPYPQAKPGDILDVYSLDYAGNHLRHAARWSMSGHLRCTFGPGQPDCESHIALDGSLLIFHGDKLEAGSGLYQGATGRILSTKEIPGAANASDVVAKDPPKLSTGTMSTHNAAHNHGSREMRVNNEGVFVAWGSGLQEVFGYTEAEVLGRKVDVLIPRVLRAKHWHGFNKAVASGQMRRPNKTFRAVGVHKDGHHIAFRSIDILNLTDDGSVEGVTAIILRHGRRSLLTRVEPRTPVRAARPRTVELSAHNGRPGAG